MLSGRISQRDESAAQRDAGALLGAKAAASTFVLQRWVSDKSPRAAALLGDPCPVRAGGSSAG